MSASRQNLSRRKIALIIGNDTYCPPNELDTCTKNAEDMFGLRKKIKFKVTKRINIKAGIMDQIQNFTRKINDGDLILVYFSGHGCQIEGENYLIPTDDTRIDGGEDVKDIGSDVTRIVERLLMNKPRCTAIVIVDCCRPYVLGNSAEPNCNGLARTHAVPGAFIQFSCAANETRKDNLFSEHLLEKITQKNVPAIDIFQGITEEVYMERPTRHQLFSIDGLFQYGPICLDQVMSLPNGGTASSKRVLSNRRKCALIIGNDNYRPKNKLQNSIKSAKKLNKRLENMNFTVTMEVNISNEDEIMEKVKEFDKGIRNGDLVLFYFSGHGYQFSGKNYLIPTDDTKINIAEDVELIGVDAARILGRLRDSKPLCAIIFILDCCRSYVLPGTSSTSSTTIKNGLHEMTIDESDKTFIQFSCAAHGTADDDFFNKHLLANICQKNRDVVNVFRHIAVKVILERYEEDQLLSLNGLTECRDVYLNYVSKFLPDIPFDAMWKANAHTVAGDRGCGSSINRLHSPQGLWMTSNRSLLIADSANHRIMKYNLKSGDIERIAGKNIQGYGPDLLARPSNVIFHKKSKSFIICDYHNRRVLQWFRGSKKLPKTIIGNIACFGLAVDEEGFLYVSDTERHEVRRYGGGKKYGKLVAGGHGQGRRLHQLNHPTYICIGNDQSVYVSDSWNDRVVRWDKGKKEGVVVAGGHGKGKDLAQLDYPTGILVDQRNTVYVADHYNHRVMRCPEHGLPDVIVGHPFLSGSDGNQLNGPEGLAFDKKNNLYVVDSNNHRIQRFHIETISNMFSLS